ncbi:MAG: DsbA family protein [Hyphomonadaceae bacterium]|nr:DsbA family protein [Hyphomonadaceae bacterium]
MISRILGGLAVAAALALACPAAARAQAQPALTPAQKEEVRALVRDYIKQNPEVVQEALDELQRRKDAALQKRLESDGRDFSLGPRNAPVTIVEFFDYRCPYCHTAMDWVFETLRRNPQTVRVIFKEFPVLGDPSVEASRAAVASIRQGKYPVFHRALMGFRGDLTSAQIDAIARRAGVDVARMRRDMGEVAVFNHLRANHEVAAEAGIQGTPAFMINGKWVRGWDAAEADRLLAEALKTARRR